MVIIICRLLLPQCYGRGLGDSLDVEFLIMHEKMRYYEHRKWVGHIVVVVHMSKLARVLESFRGRVQLSSWSFSGVPGVRSEI
jgi:hypothetical protein